MRKVCRTRLVVAGFVGLAVVVAGLAGPRLFAGDDDEDGADKAEAQKIAKEALDKSVARGNELFHGKDGVKKTCAKCHEDADKPELSLATRAFSYPSYSRKKKAVVSLTQKINEMLTTKSGGAKEMDLSGPDIVAIEAYIASLKKK